MTKPEKLYLIESYTAVFYSSLVANNKKAIVLQW